MANNYTKYALFSSQSYYWEFEGGSSADEFEVGNDIDFGVSKGAMRFQNITIPQGTTIDAAGLFIHNGQSSGSNIKIKLHCIDEDNTAAFSGSPFGRPETTDFSLLDDTIPSTGQWRPIDAKVPIQEVLNRSGWASGNALGFIVRDNGSGSNSWIFDGLGGTNSLLFIRLAALPDFTPDPTGILAPSFPKDPAYGIKIANGDVKKTATNKLFYFSGKKEPKVLRQIKFDASITNFQHGLPYTPCAIGWYEDTDGRHMCAGYFSGIDAGAGLLYVGTEAATIIPITGKTAYCYIFVDPLA